MMRRSTYWNISLLLFLPCLVNAQFVDTSTPTFDWQGHRGARGIAPENAIPAFLKALTFPKVKTLELDLAISSDSKVLVSHDPWISALFSSHPDGRPVSEAEESNLVLYQMPYKEIRKFDTGKRGNPKFPEQVAQPAYKPTLEDVVRAVRKECARTGRAVPFFNIEIKSRPDWDGTITPPVAEFARLVAQQVEALKLQDIVCVQSFDVRALQQMHAINPGIRVALLVENKQSLTENLALLGFVPEIYSPYYQLLDATTVEEAHRLGMQVLPWTVNDPSDMKKLIELGVDGIITDYPNRIPE